MVKLGIRTKLFCQSQLTPLLKESNHQIESTHNISFEKIEFNTQWSPLLSMPIKLKINSNNIASENSSIKPIKKK